MLWITGSQGLLGSAVCAKAKAVNWPFFQTGKEVDIADLAAIRAFLEKNRGIRRIINCAAFSNVDAAEIQKEEAHKTNAIGPENLAIAAHEIGAKLIHISTDYVFSGKGNTPLTETDPVGPCNYYGLTKLEGEQRALARSACVMRTSWIFGHGGKNFVSKLLQMLKTQKEIRLTEDQWGRFTYAPDLAEAIFHLMDGSGLYQFANEGVATKYEFGVAMREEALQLGFPVLAEKVIPVPGAFFSTPCERPVYSAFDTAKMASFIPIRHWRLALKDFLRETQLAYL